jgi:hypothetical protein
MRPNSVAQDELRQSLPGSQLALASGTKQAPFDSPGPWSFPWSLSERISHHLRASQGRSRAVRDLRTGPGRGSSPGSPMTGECRKASERRAFRLSGGCPGGPVGPPWSFECALEGAPHGPSGGRAESRVRTAVSAGHASRVELSLARSERMGHEPRPRPAVPFYAFTRKLVGLVPGKGVRSAVGPLSAAARTSRAGPRRARPASR